MSMKIFESTGTFKPSDYGITTDTRVDIIAVGAGGSGASSYSSSYNIGGNSGCIEYYSGTLDPSTTYPVTVGIGGASVTGSGTLATNGNNGTSSSFGALLTAQGGTGGGVTPAIGAAKGGIPSSFNGGGGAGGYEPNYDRNFAPGGSQITPQNTTPGTIPTSGDSTGNGGGVGGVSSSNRGGVSAAFGGSGGFTTIPGQPGNRGAGGGSNANSTYTGGGGGGGYGAGGGGGSTYQTTPAYGASGKGADGVVIIMW